MFINFILCFLKEYTPDGETRPVRDLGKISIQFINKGTFWSQFILLIPFPWIMNQNYYGHHFNILKIWRIKRGLSIFDVAKIMKGIKLYFIERKKDQIKKDPLIAEDTLEDHNNITSLVLLSYALNTFKLMIMILTISYFLAMFWAAICKFLYDFIEEGDNTFLNASGILTFEANFDIDTADMMSGILLMYYSFTTLSTVGFGDFSPKSESEQLIMAFTMLFGVAVFSYCLGIFIDILASFQDLSKEFDEGDELTKFLQVIQRFNGNKSLQPEFINRIQDFFEYKWKSDKNNAMSEEADLAILGQLPD